MIKEDLGITDTTNDVAATRIDRVEGAGGTLLPAAGPPGIPR
jgi:hypothetical protein